MPQHYTLQAPHGSVTLQQARSGVSSPVHRVPPEVWVIIFGFVLGREPFGQCERKAYACLRSVCMFWRKTAANQGLCTGLNIVLDDWVEDLAPPVRRDVEEKLAPWLAIINPLQPYHLMMESEGSLAFSQEAFEEAIHYLLTTTPSLTTISINADAILTAVLALTNRGDRVIRLDINLEEDVVNVNYRLRFLEHVFPNLDIFIFGSFYNYNIPFKHANLRRLVLTDIMTGFPEELSALLFYFPSLRELEVASTMDCDGIDDELVNPIRLPSIEVLTIINESLAEEILGHIILPSLKFLALEAHGNPLDQDAAILTYTNFFSRSGFTNGTISVTGFPTKPFFAALIRNLPPDVLLHVGLETQLSTSVNGAELHLVKEVFCPDLEWLEGWTNLKLPAFPAKIHVPSQLLEAGDAFKSRRRELEEIGYVVDACSTCAMEERLKAQVPWMSNGREM
ncbi:hypothetical protein BKA70DRAFT_1568651 [Coprinopsis sp. MPI-PUGE-AT-0042]|nr:hypothetical protein BKA70DRAFT_1568651 [Coprinopsis sp. MPI-PUGE-AT-0042]